MKCGHLSHLDARARRLGLQVNYDICTYLIRHYCHQVTPHKSDGNNGYLSERSITIHDSTKSFLSKRTASCHMYIAFSRPGCLPRSPVQILPLSHPIQHHPSIAKAVSHPKVNLHVHSKMPPYEYRALSPLKASGLAGRPPMNCMLSLLTWPGAAAGCCVAGARTPNGLLGLFTIGIVTLR